MARYWARLRYSPQAFKGMVDEPHSREVEVRKMCEGAGMVLREAGFCAATGEICVSFDGTAEQVGEIEFACMASGAFTEINVLEIMNFDEVVSMMTGAGRLLGRYNAPNHDEIDRLLLEE